MKYAYFPGCSLESSAKEYDMSTKAVAKVLGIELVEIEDWNCCGALEVGALDHVASVALPARNLAIAEKDGTDLIMVCNACFNRVKRTHHELLQNEDLCAKVNALMDDSFDGTIGARHFLDVLVNDMGSEEIEKKVTRRLKGKKGVGYYGCLIVRPAEVAYEDPENPTSLDTIIKLAGGEPLPFERKSKCCGGPLMVTKEEHAFALAGEILTEAQDAGADFIVVPCPMCHMALDGIQFKVERALKKKFQIPILYFTQLLGYALGLDPSELGMSRNLVSPLKVLEVE
jgi:heterodisulfide reductase subunit B